MARPSHAPDILPLFPGAVRDPLDALEDPDFSSDEEDTGELSVGRYFDNMRGRGLDEASDEEAEASDEEDEVSDEEDEASDEEAEASDEEDEVSDEEDEADSGYESLSEEDVSEEEDEDTEVEEEDEDTESEEEDEDTESEENDEDMWRFLGRKQRAARPPPAPCPIFEEERHPGGSRRHRDEDEEEEPISKRPRFSYSEDIEKEPTPSTSAGTSGGFVHFFQPPHLLHDSDSD